MKKGRQPLTIKKYMKKEIKEKIGYCHAVILIDLLLKDIRQNAISRIHRHAEINPDCPECKFRILEGFLEWYKDLLIWDEKLCQKK